MKNTACRLKIVKFVAFLKAFEKTFLRSFLQHSRYFLHWKNIFLPSLSSLLQCITDYSAESLVVMPFHPDGHLSLPFQYCSFSMTYVSTKIIGFIFRNSSKRRATILINNGSQPIKWKEKLRLSKTVAAWYMYVCINVVKVG